jgi:hypothetical protein
MNGYSSGDNAPGSSSGKSKEQIGSTEISLDNIVEGGRRKRAKFESSVSHPLASQMLSELAQSWSLTPSNPGAASFRTSSNACCPIQPFSIPSPPY